MVPDGVGDGQDVGEAGGGLDVVDLSEVQQLPGLAAPAEGGHVGGEQGLLYLGVEAAPVGLGQVGEEQSQGVDPVRQLAGGCVVPDSLYSNVLILYL